MAKCNRRKFLKKCAFAAAALATPGIIQLGCSGSSGDADLTDLAGADRWRGDALADLTPEEMRAELADAGRRASATVHALPFGELSQLQDTGMEAAKSLGFTGSALAGSTIFIKPNFVTLGLELFGVSFDPAVGECTKPELVAAVAEQCLAAGAAHVVIGEGAQKLQWDWTELFFLDGNQRGGATNLQAAVDRLADIYGPEKIELQCLNALEQWHQIPSVSPDDNVKNGIYVAKSFAEADHVISLPVMKTHQWALMTGAMKNYVGLTPTKEHGNGMSRCKLHLAYKGIQCHGVPDAGVSGSFIDIHKWRMDMGKEDFAIVDCSIALEGDGPHTAPINDGKTIHLNERNKAGQYFLLAANDLVAADMTIAALQNIPASSVKGLQMAANIGLGATEEIVLKGASIDELMVSDWKKPTLLGEDFFEPVCPA
jgi:uncharacterized protein (DUF362 family)